MSDVAIRNAYRSHYPDDQIPDDVLDELVKRFRYFDDIHRWYATPPTTPGARVGEADE